MKAIRNKIFLCGTALTIGLATNLASSQTIEPQASNLYDSQEDSKYFKIPPFEYEITDKENNYVGISCITGHEAGIDTLMIQPEVSYNDISYTVTSVGMWGFFQCSNLKFVEIPETVTEIGFFAFSYCENLEKVIIPNTLDSVYCSFQGCINLTCFNVDESNPYFSSNGPILFNKDKTKVWTYPSAQGDVVIPEGVKTTAAYFLDETKITSVTLPASLETIDTPLLTQSRYTLQPPISKIVCLAEIPPVILSVGLSTLVVDTFGDAMDDIPLYVPQKSLELYKASPRWAASCKTILPIEGSAVEAIYEENGPDTFDVYSIDGRLIKRDCSQAEKQNLPAGIYIINGTKTIVSNH